MNEEARYNSVAVALHWAIAVLILGQIAGGLYMDDLPNTSPWKFHLFQIHKSVGLTILTLTVLRLGWRLTHKVPPLPATTPGWQKIAARATHWVFYALLILTPLAGWAMVSVSPKDFPTIWFGLVEIPHLPFFEGVQDRGAAEETLKERHEFLAFTILFLLLLHVGAALKHELVDRDGVLRSMAPASAGAWVGVVALLAAIGAGSVYSLNTTVMTGSGRAAPTSESAPSIPDEAPAEDAAPAETAAVKEPADETAAEPAPDPSETVADEPEAQTAPSAPGEPPRWIVDGGASHLRFIGEEGGRRFEGEFADFTADIRFDPQALDRSSVTVTVRTASASTGDQLRDGTMTGAEWFDVDDHPTAEFISTEIRHAGGDSYEADGELTIKEATHPITLAFTLMIDGDEANAEGGVDLIRTNYGLGTDDSWLEEEEVALEVRVEFEIAARGSD